jgi:hypothetical protein
MICLRRAEVVLYHSTKPAYLLVAMSTPGARERRCLLKLEVHGRDKISEGEWCSGSTGFSSRFDPELDWPYNSFESRSPAGTVVRL